VVVEVPLHDELGVSVYVHVTWGMVSLPSHEDVATMPDLTHH